MSVQFEKGQLLLFISCGEIVLVEAKSNVNGTGIMAINTSYRFERGRDWIWHHPWPCHFGFGNQDCIIKGWKCQ